MAGFDPKRSGQGVREGRRNTVGFSLKSPRFLSNRGVHLSAFGPSGPKAEVASSQRWAAPTRRSIEHRENILHQIAM